MIEITWGKAKTWQEGWGGGLYLRNGKFYLYLIIFLEPRKVIKYTKIEAWLK
jgi:hypothetical protein